MRIRKFKDRPIENAKVTLVLEAASYTTLILGLLEDNINLFLEFLNILGGDINWL